MSWEVREGDCVEAMRAMPEASVDSIVCDPPYGLEFMGKEWDRLGASANHRADRADEMAEENKRRYIASGVTYGQNVQAMQAWHEAWAREALRVLKPGGHLLAFGGTRTYHRLACAIEDAGFEIRDCLAWLYGSGFPKSLDVSKAIDRKREDRPDVLRVTEFLADAAERAGVTRADVDAHMGTSDMGGWWLSRLLHRCACPTVEQWVRLKELTHCGDEMDAEVWRLNGRKGTPGENWEKREKVGTARGAQADSTGRYGGWGNDANGDGISEFDVTAPATPEAEQWQGWGTALKPAHEPIVMARKPLAGTVAANVLAFGTGALNIDATRIEHAGPDDLATSQAKNPGRSDLVSSEVYGNGRPQQSVNDTGRWPANVLLDEQAAEMLDEQTGELTSGEPGIKRGGNNGAAYGAESRPPGTRMGGFGDSGGASRFLYVSKASTAERSAGLGGVQEGADRNSHPT